jgi:hypothetical protein
MKKIYIRQYGGLGDIFFLQKLVNNFIDLGYDEIIWPVIKHYEYLKEYNENEKIKYISIDSMSDELQNLYLQNTISKVNDTSLYLPIDKLCHVEGNCNNFMEQKYHSFQLNFNDWQKYCKFKRYPERENKCREYFGIDKGDKFIFVNNIFASPPETYIREMNYSTNFKIVEHKLEHLNMFKFFDFSWLLENAEEIHTVETSLCYLIECLDTKASLNLYSRKINGYNQYLNFDYIKNIYKKEWNKIL